MTDPLACSLCGRETDVLHPLACPSCVGRTRWLLLQILDQIGEAIAQHDRVSVTSSVFMVAMPAANYEASTYLHQSATSGRLCRCVSRGYEACVSDLDAGAVCPDAAFVLDVHRDDYRHPSTVLQQWALAWRRLNGHEQPDAPEVYVASEANYLLEHLTRLAQHEDADLPTMHAELTDTHTWLDAILQTGTAVTKGEPCPACRGPRLERKSGEETWACPAKTCHQTYTPDEYARAVHGLVVANAEQLNARLLAERLGVPHSTVKRWASRQKRTVGGRAVYGDPLLPVAGRDAMGLNTYSVRTALDLVEHLRQECTA